MVLSLPCLRQAPGIGRGRAVSAEDAVYDELVSWPGVVSVQVDPQTVLATVILGPTLEDPLDDVVEGLRDLGVPTVEFLRRP